MQRIESKTKASEPKQDRLQDRRKLLEIFVNKKNATKTTHATKKSLIVMTKPTAKVEKKPEVQSKLASSRKKILSSDDAWIASAPGPSQIKDFKLNKPGGPGQSQDHDVPSVLTPELLLALSAPSTNPAPAPSLPPLSASGMPAGILSRGKTTARTAPQEKSVSEPSRREMAVQTDPVEHVCSSCSASIATSPASKPSSAAGTATAATGSGSNKAQKRLFSLFESPTPLSRVASFFSGSGSNGQSSPQDGRGASSTAVQSRTRTGPGSHSHLLHSHRLRPKKTVTISSHFSVFAEVGGVTQVPFVHSSHGQGPNTIATPLARRRTNPLSPSIVGSIHGVRKSDQDRAQRIATEMTEHLLRLESSGVAEDATYQPLFVTEDDVIFLIETAVELFASEPSCLELDAPIKVFGDIHGQPRDLMKHFTIYKSPDDDIDAYNYLFLGDYVDRGNRSLEVLVLLLAYKIRHPTKFFMLRGNHEDALVNQAYGFKAECEARLSSGTDIWRCFNDLFDQLPVAALIADRILCVHGGIGPNVTAVDDVRTVDKPMLTTAENGPQRIPDKIKTLLWNDPTEEDGATGYTKNPQRGQDIVAFGADIVRTFCKDNDIDLIIRAHECVMEGWQPFAGGHLITVFSATNYCGSVGNNGAHLRINASLRVTPCVIQHDQSKPSSSVNGAGLFRPPTPPRRRPMSPHYDHEDDLADLAFEFEDEEESDPLEGLEEIPLDTHDDHDSMVEIRPLDEHDGDQQRLDEHMHEEEGGEGHEGDEDSWSESEEEEDAAPRVLQFTEGQ